MTTFARPRSALAALVLFSLGCASSGGGGQSPGSGGNAPATGGTSGSGGSGGSGGTVPDAAQTVDAARTVDAAQTVDAAPAADSAIDGSVPSSDGAAAARPTAGCGKAGPATGNRTLTSGADTVKYLVSVPASYDPKTPYPLVFAFHGYGRTEVQCQKEDCLGIQAALGATAILVYQKSISDGWEDPPVRDRNVKAFQDVLAVMRGEYCVNDAQVTISGTSSGASFNNILSCRLGDQFKLSVPFDGAGNDMNCVGTPAAMIVNGVKDNVANGERVRDQYVARNGCPTKPTDELTALRTKINAAFDAKRSEYACVDYVGCTKAPVRWCEHSVPGSDGRTHEWPDQGGQAIADYLKLVP